MIALRRFAEFCRQQGRIDDAVRLHTEVLASRQRRYGEQHELTLLACERLAGLYRETHDFSAAAPLYRRISAIQKALYGDHDRRALETDLSLVYVLQRDGQFLAADQAAEELYSRVIADYGESSADALRVRMLQAFNAKRGRDWRRCEEQFTSAWRLSSEIHGPEHRETLRARNQIANAIFNQGRTSEAEQICREVCERRERTFGVEDIDVAYSQSLLGEILCASDRLGEASDCLQKSFSTHCRHFGYGSPDTQPIVAQLMGIAHTHESRGAWSEAAAVYLGLVDLVAKQTADDPHRANRLAHAAALLEQDQDWPQAAAIRLRESDELRDDSSAIWLMRRHKAVVAMIHAGNYDEAERVLHECAEGWEMHHPHDVRKHFAQGLLGEVLVAQGRFSDAEPILITSQQFANEHRHEFPKLYRRSLERLVELYSMTGQAVSAAHWQTVLDELDVAA
ncbi:MAG: tetratricopeptide repeat protein, partial [Planctomycetaceae bacterium]|nr:tetratricopeptide repeat protein [Planctomycetaceae bacterium]